MPGLFQAVLGILRHILCFYFPHILLFLHIFLPRELRLPQLATSLFFLHVSSFVPRFGLSSHSHPACPNHQYTLPISFYQPRLNTPCHNEGIMCSEACLQDLEHKQKPTLGRSRWLKQLSLRSSSPGHARGHTSVHGSPLRCSRGFSPSRTSCLKPRDVHAGS